MIIRTHKRNRSFSIYCDVRQLFISFFFFFWTLKTNPFSISLQVKNNNNKVKTDFPNDYPASGSWIRRPFVDQTKKFKIWNIYPHCCVPSDHNKHTDSTLIIVICHGNPPVPEDHQSKRGPKKVKRRPAECWGFKHPFNCKLCVCVFCIIKTKKRGPDGRKDNKLRGSFRWLIV